MNSSKRWLVLGFAWVFIFSSAVCVQADPEEQKDREAEIREATTSDGKTKSPEEAGAETGDAMKETGNAIGTGAKQIGKDVGEFFKGLTKGKEDKED